MARPSQRGLLMLIPIARKLLRHMERLPYEEPSIYELWPENPHRTEIVEIIMGLRTMGKDEAWQAINELAEKLERLAQTKVKGNSDAAL